MRERGVYLVKWGGNPSLPSSSSPSFNYHSALLVTDSIESDSLPKASTTGFMLSWVSMENGMLANKDAVAHVSPFDYEKGLQMENTYEYLRRTKFVNDKIQVLSEFRWQISASSVKSTTLYLATVRWSLAK
ncbi:unnamed protein product [Penicillium pancosmium]